MSANFASQHLASLAMASRYREIVMRAATERAEVDLRRDMEIVAELHAGLNRSELKKVVCIAVALAALGGLVMTGVMFLVG